MASGSVDQQARDSVNHVMASGAGPDPPMTVDERDRARVIEAAAVGLPASRAPSEIEEEMSPMEKLQEQIKEMEKKMVVSENLQKLVERKTP